MFIYIYIIVILLPIIQLQSICDTFKDLFLIQLVLDYCSNL